MSTHQHICSTRSSRITKDDNNNILTHKRGHTLLEENERENLAKRVQLEALKSLSNPPSTCIVFDPNHMYPFQIVDSTEN